MRGNISIETLIIFVGSILSILLVGSLIYTSLTTYTNEASSTASTVYERTFNVVEVISTLHLGPKTYFLVRGVSGEIPLKKVLLLVDGVPYSFTPKEYKGDGDDVLERGELFYLIVPGVIPEGASLSLSSTSVSTSLGTVTNPVDIFFPYRVKVTVSNTSGSYPTDYPVRIELNSSNFPLDHLSPDCSDLRPVDESFHPLPYFLEECSPSRVVLWVKLPVLDASNTLYLLYGRSGLPDESNGHEVFIFFDDFEDLSGWICSGDCNYVKTTIYDGKTALLLTAPAGDGVTLYTKKTLSGLDNVALEIYTTLVGNAGDLDFRWGVDDDYRPLPNWGSTPGDNAANQYHRCIVDESYAVSGSTYLQNTWLVDSVKRMGPNVYCSYNGEDLSATGTPIDSGLLQISADPDTTTREIYIDWIRVRKIVDPEPTVTISSEESGRFYPQ